MRALSFGLLVVLTSISVFADDPKPNIVVEDEAGPAVIDRIEVALGKDTKTWTYTVTFADEPDGERATSVAASLCGILKRIEDRKVAPDFTVKTKNKCTLIFQMKTDKGDEPIFRSVKRLKDEELVTYEVTFVEPPTADQVKGTVPFFMEQMPNALVLAEKPNGKWNIKLQSQWGKEKKTARFSYEAERPDKKADD